MTGTLVVKYGGAAMEAADEAALLDDVAAHSRAGWEIVLIHGGGPEIDRELAVRGIATRRIHGLRVTDAATLGVVEATLCGRVNKRLVRALGSRGVPAVGICGQDGATLVAERRVAEGGSDLGFVGEVTRVEPALVRTLLGARYVPVVAPLAISLDGASALNVNADTAAGALAAALRADALLIITDVPRVLRDPSDAASAIDRLDLDEARNFAQTEGCQGSMRPKIEAAIAAVESGVRLVCIGAAHSGAITRALAGDATIVSLNASKPAV